MECKKVQDQLITEYLDNETDAGEKAVIEQHLTVCTDCREFFGAVQKTAVAPFKETGEMRPDSTVWEQIQKKLATEGASSAGWFGRWADHLILLLKMPQPVFRVAFVTALILVVVVLAKWPSTYADPVYGYMSEQMMFMGELRAGNPDLLNGDLKDYEVVFEEMGG